MQWPSPNDSPQLQTPPINAPPFRLAITPYRKRLPLPMTSHYRNRRTFAGQTESPSRKCMGIRKSALLDNSFSCESGVPFGVSFLASHRLPCPFLPALAGQRIRLRPNGMAVRGSLVLWLTIVRLFVREGVVERAVVVAQRQHVHANATGHRTSIPFGHHAISKMLALADSLALSEPPDICRPNGISVSQVYGVTEAVRFSITRSLASLGFRLASPPSRATACLIRFCPHLRVTACAFRPNGMAVRGSLVLWLTIVRLFVRVGGNRMCSGRHPTTARMRKRHRVTHLHSFWPPRHTGNACPCR